MKLTSVYCPSQTPPILKNTNVFANNTLKGTLYVPIGCKGAYEKVDPWRNFWNIEEMEFTGVDDIFGDDDNVTVSVVNGEIFINGTDAYIPMVEVYTINGACIYRGSDTRISNLARGVYVVRVGSKTIKVVL